MTRKDDIKNLALEFGDCASVLTALGDENRIQLLCAMMQMGECDGARVGDITEKSHLSRPAVSHHLKILKDAGIIEMRREGTKNYYYFAKDQASMKKLIGALEQAVKIAAEIER